MTSHTSSRFRTAFEALPERVQRSARRAHRLFLKNPQHPSLQFKQVHPTRPIYSARVSLGYRALAVREGDDLIWFWTDRTQTTTARFRSRGAANHGMHATACAVAIDDNCQRRASARRG